MRQIILEVQQSDLHEILRGEKSVELPQGARIVSDWREQHWDDTIPAGISLFLRIEHESYAEVQPGRRMPTLPAKFRIATKPAELAATAPQKRRATA